MTPTDELIYNALCADTELMRIIGGRIKSTVFETGPDGVDNTPLPYIVVTDDGGDAEPESKDCVWLPDEEQVTASVIVSAESPKAVRKIINRCRRTIGLYMQSDEHYAEAPTLRNIRRDGRQWDWTKPCYWDALRYICDEPIDYSQENE